MAFKVVLTGPMPATPADVETLAAAGATLVKIHCPTEETLIANCRDADGLLVGANEPYTSRVIAELENCRVLSRMGIGFNNIDVEAATEKGIPVSIVPDYCVDEVSDHAMAFILTYSRGIMRVVVYGALLC